MNCRCFCSLPLCHLQNSTNALPRALRIFRQSRPWFVVELIRNAEDKHYTRAALANAKPYIRFGIHPRKIVVETNEDGFAAADVQAICTFGRSTKTSTATPLRTMEKGIGFMSVFTVSSKVYINSGPFSFFFKHERGDSGLGIITPVYCEYEEVLKEPQTRITLTLLDNLNYEDLKTQFHDLPGTILLFLEKLKSCYGLDKLWKGNIVYFGVNIYK